MTIVCATDFSGAAEHALDVAARIAARANVPLSIVHVIEELGAELTLRSDQEAVYDPVRRKLAGALSAARRLGASAQTALLGGDPANVVSMFARTSGASLVVVGGGAERIARAAPVPILLVRAAERLHAWLGDERALSLLFGLDRSRTSHGAARWLRTLAGMGPVRVDAVHLVGMEEPDPSQLEAALARDFAADFDASSADMAVSIRAMRTDGPRDRALVAAAAEVDADLVVVGSHQRAVLDRLWNGSVSRGVLQLADRSALLVPTSVADEGRMSIPAIRHVLVATDLSPLGNRAIGHALSLLPNGGTIHLVHVQTARAGGPTAASELLEQLVPPGAGRRAVRVTCHVLEGDVAESLCSMADRLGVDVLCMSSRGRPPASAAILGSSTQRVLARSNRPVFVVLAPER